MGDLNIMALVAIVCESDDVEAVRIALAALVHTPEGLKALSQANLGI